MRVCLLFMALISMLSSAQAQKKEAKRIITSLNELYAGCNNVLDVYVYQAPENVTFDYVVVGGETSEGKTKNQLVISPTSSVVTLKVFQGRDFVGQRTLVVTNKPKPAVVAYVNGVMIDQQSKVARDAKEITLMAQYGEGIKKCISGEFKVKSWSAMLLKDNKAIQMKTSETSTMDITEWKRSLRKGERILIEVRRVVKVKKSGEEEEINIGSLLLNLVLD